LAAVRATEGATELALELATYILHHPASSKETQDRATQLRAELEAQLTLPQIEATQARTQDKSFDAIVREIVSAGYD
jgi:hypothetical protein